jgi:thymidylate synthase (FAD)
MDQSKFNVMLVAATKPYNVPCETGEEFIAYAARVSNPANQDNKETSSKLLRYLIREAHWSPFEMVHVVMEIKTTRDISRQILRHRSFSFQEFSQRYAQSENFITNREARLQDTKMFQIEFERAQSRVLFHAEKEYKAALKQGIAKEQARALLPEGLTETTLYMAGTLRSWIHYVDLRAANGTQKEHMEIARQCKYILSEEYSFLNDYWDD